MPTAHLLGYGAPELREIGDKIPKVLPKNIAYIGSRSYEPPEKVGFCSHYCSSFVLFFIFVTHFANFFFLICSLCDF